LIENGIARATTNAILEQQKATNDSKFCNLKVKNYHFQSIDRIILETILVHDTKKR